MFGKLISSTVTYLILDEPVENPKPDRRVSRDWREAEVFPKGTYTLTEETYNPEYEDRPDFTHTIKRIRKLGGYKDLYHTGGLIEKEALKANAIMEKLRPLGRLDHPDVHVRVLMDKHNIGDVEDLVRVLTVLTCGDFTWNSQMGAQVSDAMKKASDEMRAKYEAEGR